MLRRTTQIALATAVVAAAAAFAPAANAERIGFNVSIGGPDYGVTFGNAPYWRGPYYRPYRRLAYVPVPAPVVYAPPVVYRAPVYTAPVVYRAPRVVYGVPHIVRRPVVVSGPYYRY